MEKRKNYIEEIIEKNSNNELEAFALRQELREPTPTKDLPNLKKDIIVLDLINRTNETSTIDLFGLPAGINPSQGIEYGDLFETKYSSTIIPINEFLTSQSYTINWTDEDGNPQSATSSVVSNIDDLVFSLNNITQDNFGYYEDGLNYVLHKEPIDTWVYWTPPTDETTSGALTTLNTSNTITNGRRFARIGARLWVLENNILQYFLYPPSAAGGGIGVPLISALNNTLVLDSTNNRLLCYTPETNLAPIEWLIKDSTGVTTLFSGEWFPSFGITGLAGVIWDEFNELYWGYGNTIAADNDIYIFDKDMVLLDTWVNPESLGIQVAQVEQNVGRQIVPMINGDIWICSGRFGGVPATSGFYKIGGYNSFTQTIIKTVVTFYPNTVPSSLYMPIQDSTTDGSNIIWGISDTALDRYAIFRVDLSSGSQNFNYPNNGSSTKGGIYYSPSLNRLFIHTQQNNDAEFNVYAYTDNTLELNSDALVVNGTNSELDGFFWDEANQIVYKSQTLSNQLSAANVTLTANTPPAGTRKESFYTLNVFIDITADVSTNTYLFTTYTVLGGTGISVTETSGNFSYESLVQALRTNLTPYFFKDMTIYANNIDQANVPIKKVLRGMSGVTKTMINNPTVLTQNKFVVSEDIAIAPKTLNEIDYKILPFQSVRIIINYTKGNLNAIADTIDAYISDGVPFSASLNQLTEKVTEDEKKYLEETLKSIWQRKKRELAREGVEVDVDAIFEPQQVIDSKKKFLIGKKMSLIKKHLENKRLENMNVKAFSSTNIRSVVANYVAKEDADKIYDPYSYVDGNDKV